MSLPAIVSALCRPETFGGSGAVQLLQTHISYVFLTDVDAYKVKKPVRFSFLDFSTLELRRHFCHEEVRLNRRLAGDVYRGVVGIAFDGTIARIVVEDDPQAVEYAVHMRRLPHDRTLDQLLQHGAALKEMMAAWAQRLVIFHRQAAATDESTANGAPEAVWRILNDNYTNVVRFRGVTIDATDDDAIQRFSRSFLAANGALMRRRQDEKRIRECHGDLHTDHIYFTRPPVIVDCIEFNTQFRFCDVASEIAFLAMDIDFHEWPDLTRRLVETYVRLSEDRELPKLLPFYQCYRAYVRGKVDSLQSLEPEMDEENREQVVDSARRHFDLAYRYTWKQSPAVVLITGLSGTGKSSVAAALSERTGFRSLSSDAIRKELAALAPAGSRGEYDSGLYAPEHTERTYAALLERASQELAAGSGVILDATFQRRGDRDAARALAARFRVPFLSTECISDDAVVRRRLDERSAQGNSLSDADWRIYLEQRKRFEPIADDEANHLRLDTAVAPQQSTRVVEAALRQLFETSSS